MSPRSTSDADGLLLLDGMLYTEFRKCITHIVLDTYDALNTSVVVRDRASFFVLLNILVGHFMDPTAFADQKHYMDMFKKPFKTSNKFYNSTLHMYT